MNASMFTTKSVVAPTVEKEKTRQEHIDSYHDGLKALERRMKDKRDKLRMLGMDGGFVRGMEQ